MLPLDAEFKVCAGANAFSICFKVFARLLMIDLIWQVKVEFGGIKYGVLVKSSINIKLSLNWEVLTQKDLRVILILLSKL